MKSRSLTTPIWLIVAIALIVAMGEPTTLIVQADEVVVTLSGTRNTWERSQVFSYSTIPYRWRIGLILDS